MGKELYVGQVVILHTKDQEHLDKVGHDEGVPAIVTRVHSATCVNVIAFLDGGAHAHEFHSSVTDNETDFSYFTLSKTEA